MTTSEKNYPEEPTDPQVENFLQTLRPTPSRDPGAVERGRARFLAEIDEAGIGMESPTWLENILSRLKSRKNHFGDKEELNMQPRRFAFTSLAIIILAVALLFGGASITAAAAQGAIPGDALYKVKTTLEDTRLSLARDAGNRAQMKMGFAERRLEEITALVEAGRYSEVGLTAQEFEAEIRSAITELSTISAGDPTRAASIASQITAALSQYAQTLTAMAATAPESVKPDLNRALITTQKAEGLSHAEDAGEFTGTVEAMGAGVWVVGGREIAVNAMTEIKGSIQVGDLVKIHLIQDATSTLTAREIQPAGQEADGEANGNDNGNLNVNDDNDANVNENANSNNDDGNENEIEEDNTNDNANDNGDVNVNENANDDGDDGEDIGNGNDVDETVDESNVNANIDENANSNTDDESNVNANIDENANSNSDDESNVNTNTNSDEGHENGGGNSGPGGGGEANENGGGGNDNGGD